MESLETLEGGRRGKELSFSINVHTSIMNSVMIDGVVKLVSQTLN